MTKLGCTFVGWDSTQKCSYRQQLWVLYASCTEFWPWRVKTIQQRKPVYKFVSVSLLFVCFIHMHLVCLFLYVVHPFCSLSVSRFDVSRVDVDMSLILDTKFATLPARETSLYAPCAIKPVHTLSSSIAANLRSLPICSTIRRPCFLPFLWVCGVGLTWATLYKSNAESSIVFLHQPPYFWRCGDGNRASYSGSGICKERNKMKNRDQVQNNIFLLVIPLILID